MSALQGFMVTALTLIGIVGCSGGRNDLPADPSAMQKELEKLLPVGTSFERSIEIADSLGFEVRPYDENSNGFTAMADVGSLNPLVTAENRIDFTFADGSLTDITVERILTSM